jgi:formate dehydrogenase iron-sulfur subunit
VSARIYISSDSGALCMGAEEVATAFREAFEKHGLDIDLVRTGSRGLYWLEPLVEVARSEGRVGYGPIRASDVDGLLDGGMLEGKQHRLGLGLVEDIPWLKSQTRLTFKNCGIVDPRSLEDYKAHGGYHGLAKAIDVGPEAIVEEVVNSGLRGRGGAGFPTGIEIFALAA